MNEAYSWKALPFNDLSGTTDSNMPESCSIRSLHSKRNSNSDTEKDKRLATATDNPSEGDILFFNGSKHYGRIIFTNLIR